MSELKELTVNNYSKIKVIGSCYCVKCYYYKNIYHWQIEDIRDVNGTAECCNCLEQRLISKSFFIDKTKKEIEHKLDEFVKKIL